ncbi:helix-turn-helix transcriptional regulator [Jidongwangia harbinensis]|uniref:helix-turn-helix transcriptional regulator n=1 Tax=Jidongwangia harbinensis TaxID=2878561 RepID=UPI001CDA219A|nr:helix-turn-helix transcriptional regulator [Jidongwangia harbinensis]MCA2213804.1 helix-turn-helix transcriptional regulator [Jidongwangia harbinensis]
MTSVTTVPIGAAVPSLARWGLSIDADLVFRTLTTFGPRSARTLASELGLSRGRVDDGLTQLYECGAAIPLGDGRAPQWQSRPPDEVVQSLRARRLRAPNPTAAVRRHRAVFDLLNARLSGVGVPLNPALAGTVADGVRYLPSRETTRRRLAHAMLNERHEHLVINNEESDTADTTNVLPFDESRYRRGVTFRIIGQPPLDGDMVQPAPEPERVLRIPSYLFRESLDTPLKLFVCDRRTAFVPADPGDVERGYLEITQPEVIQTLIDVFESRWAYAVDPGPLGVPAIALTQREHDLVNLLALGHTDVTAAQELLISARSVTNTLRTLMDRLGVDNRFQLGLALGAMRVTAPPSLTD